MDTSTHRARITGPVAYLGQSGQTMTIPIGPCLIESQGGPCIDVVWGAQGQRSVALSVDEVRAAWNLGHLVLLD